ncbi:MAG: hypothetical protein B7X34_09170 [Acidobacteriia bacterium 12-62-4]|nr:MAG: hypothetical protein B7X34_09170 [Acidobacteriia bacterium 12-62-4]
MLRLAWSFGLLAVLSFAQQPTSGVIAIRGAGIHPANAPAIPSGTIVLRNGLIEAVGPNVPIPAEAFVIEGAGLQVYPGLIDALSTWGLPTGPARPAPAAAPGPTPATPAALEQRIQTLDDGGPEERPSNASWVRAADLLDPKLATLTAARNAGYTTAIGFPGTNVFAGQGSAYNVAGTRARQMVVEDAVGQMITLPVRGFGGGFPGSLMGIISYVRQIYADADHYKASQALYSKDPRGLPRPPYDRALDGVIASPRLLLPASRLVEIDRMVRFGQELKQPLVLYGGAESFRGAVLLAAAKVPMLINLRWPEAERDADPFVKDPLRVLETRDLAPTGPAALAKAGVKFAFYSGGVERPADLRKAIKKAVDAGLSKEEALKALTLYPAQIFGLDNRIGSLEAGKIANLTVIDGDLFDDRAKLKFTIIDGVKYEPAPETTPEPNR